jgi:hypothetical protein
MVDGLVRVRVVSDGTLHGTHVTVADTGRSIPCSAVRWEHQIARAPKLVLEIPGTFVEVDLMAEADLPALKHRPRPEGGS